MSLTYKFLDLIMKRDKCVISNFFFIFLHLLEDLFSYIKNKKIITYNNFLLLLLLLLSLI